MQQAVFGQLVGLHLAASCCIVVGMTTTAQTFPLRVARTTTGVVHAARERRVEIFDYSKPVEDRGTGQYRTVTVKACGAEPNTGRRIAGTDGTTAEVTCKKCRKVLGL